MLRNPASLRSLQPPAKLRTLLLIAALLALVWWALAWALRNDARLLVWDDLYSTFNDPIAHLSRPYDTPGYFTAPWGNLFLIPFDPLPLPSAALGMVLVYFLLIAGIVYRFGGGRAALLVALTSILAVDTAIEINLDWIVCIGLLVPAQWSAPFLMVKPQTALGYVLSFTRRQFVRATIVALVVLLLSFLIWGFWLIPLLENIQRWETNALVNIAPMVLLPRLVSFAIGIALALYALRKHDPVIATAAGVFFVPYIAPTSFLLTFALLSVRFTRVALLASGVIWLVVLAVALPFFR